MKKATWLPAVVAFGLGLVMVFAALLLHGPHVLSYSPAILGATLGFLFMAYLIHFIGQQDIIGGGCRPYAIGLRGGLLMLFMFMQFFFSVGSWVFASIELGKGSEFAPSGVWVGLIGLHMLFYVFLLSSSHIKAKEDETIFVNGKALKQGESFFLWPWLVEEYQICRHWSEHPAPVDALHQS
jgi:hypothetical protein